jgi:hypothetical protein
MFQACTTLRQLLMLVIAFGGLVSFVACKKESSPAKAPAPAVQGPDTGVGGETVTPGGDDDDNDGFVATSSLKITPLSASLQFPIGQPVRANFTVSGSNGRVILVGLAQASSGMMIEGASSTSPVLVWNSPLQGTYSVAFILRDKAACLKAESTSAACDLSVDVTETPNTSYDKVSEVFQIVVGNAVVTPGGNTNIISLIIPLATQLISGGGGGGISIAQLLPILIGMSSGQLQTVLTSLQNNGGAGGTLDLASILSQMGFTLTAPVEVSGG